MAFDSISETGETALAAQLINAVAAGEKEMAGCTGNPDSKTGQQGSERQDGADTEVDVRPAQIPESRYRGPVQSPVGDRARVQGDEAASAE